MMIRNLIITKIKKQTKSKFKSKNFKFLKMTLVLIERRRNKEVATEKIPEGILAGSKIQNLTLRING